MVVTLRAFTLTVVGVLPLAGIAPQITEAVPSKFVVLSQDQNVFGFSCLDNFVAVVEPLYTLLATVVLVTVRVFGVMLAVTLAG